jgi:hypothetical protein
VLIDAGRQQGALKEEQMDEPGPLDDEAVRQELLARIRAKRASIAAYVGQLEPRGTRLMNLSIICSALAAVLTAGPALGGEDFTGSAQRLMLLADDALVWQVLCLAATVAALGAVVATNLYKAGDLPARLSRAEAASAQLEGLEALVEFGRLPVEAAVTLYQQYVAAIPALPDQPAAPA